MEVMLASLKLRDYFDVIGMPCSFFSLSSVVRHVAAPCGAIPVLRSIHKLCMFSLRSHW